MHVRPQCMPSDTVPIRSRTWTRRRLVTHRHLPYHTIPYSSVPFKVQYHTMGVLPSTQPVATLGSSFILIPYHGCCYRRHHGHTPYHTIPCHTMPYHTTPYHTIPYHTLPYHTVPPSYPTILYHAMPYHAIPCHCHTLPYHTIPYPPHPVCRYSSFTLRTSLPSWR